MLHLNGLALFLPYRAIRAIRAIRVGSTLVRVANPPASRVHVGSPYCPISPSRFQIRHTHYLCSCLRVCMSRVRVPSLRCRVRSPPAPHATKHPLRLPRDSCGSAIPHPSRTSNPDPRRFHEQARGWCRTSENRTEDCGSARTRTAKIGPNDFLLSPSSAPINHAFDVGPRLTVSAATHAEDAVSCDGRTFEGQRSTPTVPKPTTNTHRLRVSSGASLGVWGEPPKKDRRVGNIEMGRGKPDCRALCLVALFQDRSHQEPKPALHCSKLSMGS